MNNLEKNDNEVFNIIQNEHTRQLQGIELIASENFVSENVLEVLAVGPGAESQMIHRDQYLN